MNGAVAAAAVTLVKTEPAAECSNRIGILILIVGQKCQVQSRSETSKCDFIRPQVPSRFSTIATEINFYLNTRTIHGCGLMSEAKKKLNTGNQVFLGLCIKVSWYFAGMTVFILSL